MLTLETLVENIKENIEPIDTMLVLGCGEGRYEYELGAKQTFGIDICDEKLDKCIQKGMMVTKQDVRNLSNFIAKSFHTITMFDLLEHFTKETGLIILKDIERIASGQIILFIPVQTEFDKWGASPEEQERLIVEGKDAGYHLSMWTPQEMETLGYKVIYNPTFHGDFGAVLCIKSLINHNVTRANSRA